DVQDEVAAIAGGRDVQEGELVGALLVVARGDLDGIARIAQFHEVDALDDPATRHVQAGNDSFSKHEGRKKRRREDRAMARTLAAIVEARDRLTRRPRSSRELVACSRTP